MSSMSLIVVFLFVFVASRGLNGSPILGKTDRSDAMVKNGITKLLDSTREHLRELNTAVQERSLEEYERTFGPTQLQLLILETTLAKMEFTHRASHTTRPRVSRSLKEPVTPFGPGHQNDLGSNILSSANTAYTDAETMRRSLSEMWAEMERLQSRYRAISQRVGQKSAKN